MAPQRTRAALRMNMAPTVSGAGFEKTEKALLGSSRPVAMIATKSVSAVRSGEIFSRTKLTSVAASRTKMRAISQVMVYRCGFRKPDTSDRRRR